jgi:sugar O-acyltransferase (sialic acid O-acetyltransferase NeuD family)
MKKAIIGAGGFGREVYWSLPLMQRITAKFFVDDKYWDDSNPLILPISKFNPTEYEVVVAIGDPIDRFNMIQNLPKDTKYFTHIDASVEILDPNVEIGEGSIICAGCILTTNIKLGKHAHLNLQTTIGHDCEIGDYFTTAPGVKVSGNCNIGNSVYIGTNASVKQQISIIDSTTIGMNAAVVKNIEQSGTYVGVPAKRIK